MRKFSKDGSFVLSLKRNYSAIDLFDRACYRPRNNEIISRGAGAGLFSRSKIFLKRNLADVGMNQVLLM